MEPKTPESPPRCPACGTHGGAGALFCASCGFYLGAGQRPAISLPVDRARDAWKKVRSAALFYLSLLAVVLLLGGDFGDETVARYLAGDAATAVLVVGFAWPIRRDIVRLFRPPRMDAVSWALLAFGPAVLWLLNHGLVYAFRDVPGTFVSDPVLELRQAGASTTIVLLLVCVTPPLLEELAFRGVLLERIRESFGTQPAAIVVSILFSVLHLALLSFVPLAALALVFAALRVRTGSLWPAVVGHALFNLPGIVFPV